MAEALEGKPIHEFHLSTNYRNSSEIYAHAAAYAERVGLDADLPTAVRSTGIEPVERYDVADLEAATREAVTEIAGQVGGTIGIVVPVARRSEVNAWLASWSEFADDASGARSAVDSSVAPSGEDRIVKAALKPATDPDVPHGLPVIPEELRPTARVLTRGSRKASEDEVLRNPRAASSCTGTMR